MLFRVRSMLLECSPHVATTVLPVPEPDVFGRQSTIRSSRDSSSTSLQVRRRHCLLHLSALVFRRNACSRLAMKRLAESNQHWNVLHINKETAVHGMDSAASMCISNCMWGLTVSGSHSTLADHQETLVLSKTEPAHEGKICLASNLSRSTQL